jgi:para-aminobenzoate synthetase component 1
MLLNDISIDSIHSEQLNIQEPFLEWSARFTHQPGTVLLMSGGDLDCARYHILGIEPWMQFTGRHRQMTISCGDQRIHFEADPFDTLNTLLSHFSIENDLPDAPISAGLLGYLAYDLKDALEKIPQTTIDDLGLPHIYFYAPSIFVVHDRQTGSSHLHIPVRRVGGQSLIAHDIERFRQIASATVPVRKELSDNIAGFKSNFSRGAYVSAIEKIIDYIGAGDVYQVNMSQRFETEFGDDPFALFTALYKKNPAPFFAYIHAGDHHILSTSPERFIQQIGNRIETRPIKGTRPRGKSESEDRELRDELLTSRKDDAELSMIVDLLRNDLGKVCQGGSVRVKQHKRLEAYQNVYHLVSIVEGILQKGRNAVDLIRATFPGGSITGCPKIRSMEIIDELEPHRRHIYTGSIGYLSFHETMDLSIAIRTATICNDKMIFSVGGGIVYDSSPEDEFNETLHKGATLISTFGRQHQPDCQSYVWMNGCICLQEEAKLPIADLGVQYGFGFFETIRVEKGCPVLLEEHLHRFDAAWRHHFPDEPPQLSWNQIIGQVIEANSLTDKTAAVKIVVTMGSRTMAPFDHNLYVQAREYRHRLKVIGKSGLRLATYPEARLTPLADYKSMNYLYYFLAGEWAAAHSADEALVLNPDGSISETNTANILLITKNTVYIPISPHVLPGVMQNRVCKFLEDRGFQMESRIVLPEELFGAEQAMLTNSLMGAVPVESLDGKKLRSHPDLCTEINQVVLTKSTQSSVQGMINQVSEFRKNE